MESVTQCPHTPTSLPPDHSDDIVLTSSVPELYYGPLDEVVFDSVEILIPDPALANSLNGGGSAGGGLTEDATSSGAVILVAYFGTTPCDNRESGVARWLLCFELA